MSDTDAANLFSSHGGNGRDKKPGEGTAAFTRTAATKKPTYQAKAMPQRDPRLFTAIKDVHAGLRDSAGILVAVEKADRMPSAEAGDKFKQILEMYGLSRAEDGVQVALLRGLCLNHTFNSGSTLQPHRCRIWLDEEVIDYSETIKLLGTDYRRFFRAYADVTRGYNRQILDEYDPHDVTKTEQYNWLIQVAEQRGISRYPELAHDSADCCGSLDPAMRSAIAASKKFVISTGLNTADSRIANQRTASLDGFDSTAKEDAGVTPRAMGGRHGAG